MERLVGIADRIDGFLRRLAHTTGWLFLVAVVIICFDVVTRKLGYQLPYFTSTQAAGTGVACYLDIVFDLARLWHGQKYPCAN